MLKIYTIPPDKPFLACLAEGLWRQADGNGERLAAMLVLLPTRRAALHLREAFLKVTDRAATLLPRMVPLSTLEEDGFYFLDPETEFSIPPAISPLRRRLLLTRLIAGRDARILPDQAAQLAEALAKFLDEAQTAERDLNDLGKLVPENLAAHWQETLKFLTIITEQWPKVLAEEGVIDPAERQRRLLAAQAKLWRAKPPAHPVIAAGVMGVAPSVIEILSAVADLPQGAVVLPGHDGAMDEEAWQAAEESHPQFEMKNLLERMKVPRGDVKLWPVCAEPVTPRVRLLHEAMRPAETTAAWRDLNAEKIPLAALENISRLTLATPQEEAQVVALAMRAALDVPGKTAMLVTPDRALAERTAAALARWGIVVNDSAGISLRATPPGGFLLDVLAAARPGGRPVDCLALLKHPIAAMGLEPAACRAMARAIEVGIWRAPRIVDTPEIKTLHRRLNHFKKTLTPLAQKGRQKKPLAEWLAAHLSVAEHVAASDTESGAARLWRGEAGEAAADFCDRLREAAHDFPPLSGADYAALFAEFLRGETVRPAWGLHPRLSILGVLEARLIHADLVILGALNEKSWPPETEIDPWMSRPMKKAFGLAPAERRIGLAAHDFVQRASAPEVLLTRSRREGRAPTVPSRFLLQLETVLEALGYHRPDRDALKPAAPWAEWARRLDEPAEIAPCPPPAPCPPLSARPRSLSVTEIGTWRRNPYAIYARRILRLEKLEPLEIEIAAAERGIAIHAALEKFLVLWPRQLPPEAEAELLRIGREEFAIYNDQPQVGAFWWPRFARAARWFVAEEKARRAAGIYPLKAEAQGALTLADGFTLRGRADRIDRLPDGSLSIIDYKTGSVPTQKDILAGLEPQLPLLALMASEGVFPGIDAADVSILGYWLLGGAEEKTQTLKEPVGTLIDAARAGLENLLARYADPAMPYRSVPQPGIAPRYDDYAHLARLAEWGAMREENEAEETA